MDERLLTRPHTVVMEKKNTIEHALNCKVDRIRNLDAELLREVAKDVKVLTLEVSGDRWRELSLM